MTVTNATRSAKPTTFADILDKGLVIDAFVRISLVGIEILTIDARIVLASVDTYLQFAEAVNRLDLYPQRQPAGLPEMLGTGRHERHGAAAKTKGLLEGLKDKASDIIDTVRPDKPQHGRSDGESSEDGDDRHED